MKSVVIRKLVKAWFLIRKKKFLVTVKIHVFWNAVGSG